MKCILVSMRASVVGSKTRDMNIPIMTQLSAKVNISKTSKNLEASVVLDRYTTGVT